MIRSYSYAIAFFITLSLARAVDAPSKIFAPDAMFVTPLSADDLDPAAFAMWVDGAEKAIDVKDGPRHAIWTLKTQPGHDGVAFGDTKNPGARHLRIAWKKPLLIGTVLLRAGGQVSALKPDAAYPGDLSKDSDWIPAQHIRGGKITRDETEREDYTLWVLPPNTQTRALRFTHIPAATDPKYAGWIGGAFVLSQRFINVSDRAIATASARDEDAGRINDGTNNGTWKQWDNGKDGGETLISAEHPEWAMLTWPAPVSLVGLNALWAGFSAGDVQIYGGPAERHPREATVDDWRVITSIKGISSGYPLQLWPNWIGFGQTVQTRAIRLRMTQVVAEKHPHLKDSAKNGKRIWLGELMALQSLGDAPLETALAKLPSAEIASAEKPHPPIPIRFKLDKPGFVSIAIDDAQGVRVRNLIGETPFPAGDNVAWWDGTDDLRRDPEAAKHGVYHIPAQLVAPGKYHARGLYRQAVDLRYEFSVYNAGSPPWPTSDHAGGWLTNHTPPNCALFVPGDRAPGGKPIVYLGSYVSEGGDGLAWVDLDGRKQGGVGWVGGTWTGAQFTARDVGDKSAHDGCIYVASSWSSDPDPKKAKDPKGEIRLTAFPIQSDKPLLKYIYVPPVEVERTPAGDSKWGMQLGGVAARNGLVVFTMSRLNELVFVDAKAKQVIAKGAVQNPRGLAFDSAGRLLVLSGKQLQRYQLPEISAATTLTLPAPQILIADRLEDPQQIALDSKGNLYISDQGASHQVKVFDPAGKFLRAIGKAGVPKAGPYDPNHLNNPNGLTVDSNDRLWVAETDFQPKRVSVWTLDGQLVKAYYGPSEYGGGGALDPQDKTRFYYHGMEFKLDWEKGRDQLVSVLYRPGPDDMKLPNRSDGHPQTALYVKASSGGGTRKYFTNCYNCNPTNGAAAAFLWLERNGIAVPVAAMGRANDWELLKGDAFKPRWPAGVDLRADMWKNPAVFAWSDANGDGRAQPEEVTFAKAKTGGVTVMPDLSFVLARVDDRAMRYAPRKFTEQGAPAYDLAAGEEIIAGVQPPTSSGGDQALIVAGGWTVLTVAPKPFAPQSVGGAYKGKASWSYPSLWPGLHASHESPPPDHPGELIGTTRLLGGFFTPRAGDAGPLWAVNGNQGNMYVLTADGLFVATLFRDVRDGHKWAMPSAERGMLLNDLSLHDENFWPSVTQTADGQVYLVDGGRTSLVRVNGLETIRRLPDADVTVTADDLKNAQAYLLQVEAQRQKSQGRPTLKVALRKTPPIVDGKADDWAGADWAPVDKSGVAAYFNSDSKPFNVTAAVAVAGDRLYAAFRTGDAKLLANSGETPRAQFKTGGALDLMIGANPGADEKRSKPAEGDQRLLICQAKGKTVAILFRPVAPGAKEPMPFSSPWRTITFDSVEDVSGQIQLAGSGGDYEISVPLSLLNLKPQAGMSIKADLGVLRGNGFQTLRRVYWSNKATGIVSDVPSEAELSPQLWGKWEFKQE